MYFIGSEGHFTHEELPHYTFDSAPFVYLKSQLAIGVIATQIFHVERVRVPPRTIYEVVFLSLRLVDEHIIIHFSDNEYFVHEIGLLVALDHDLEGDQSIGLLNLFIAESTRSALAD